MQATHSERSSIKDDSSQLRVLSFSKSKLGWILLTLVGILGESYSRVFSDPVFLGAALGRFSHGRPQVSVTETGRTVTV